MSQWVGYANGRMTQNDLHSGVLVKQSGRTQKRDERSQTFTIPTVVWHGRVLVLPLLCHLEDRPLRGLVISMCVPFLPKASSKAKSCWPTEQAASHMCTVDFVLRSVCSVRTDVSPDGCGTTRRAISFWYYRSCIRSVRHWRYQLSNFMSQSTHPAPLRVALRCSLLIM